MERDSLRFQTLKNISYSTIGYIWPMILTLFVTPVIISNLGVKDYGIYIFINAIIALLGILDFGIGMTITRNLSYYLGAKNDSAIKALIRTGNSLFLIIAIIGLLCASGITILELIAPNILPTSFAAYNQYSSLILIAGVIFFINTIDTVYGAIIYSLQRFDISNIIGMTSITASSLSILTIVLIGGSLQDIFLIQLIINAAIALATFYYAKKILPQAEFKLGWDQNEVKKSLAFSAAISINNIANSALSYLDRLIIPFFTGPSGLTYYSVPGNVTSRIPSFSNTLSTTIFPTTSQLEGGGDKIRLENLYIRSFRLITMIAAAITITAIAFAHKVLLYWLNADFADKSTHILIILAVTNFILALFGPLSSFLLGLGKLRFITTMSVIMGTLNAILLIILLPQYGINGAAWAYLISVLPVGYMFYHTEKQYLALSGRKKYYFRKILATITASSIVWLIDIYVIYPFIINLTTLICAGILSFSIYIIVYKLFGFFEEEDWKDIKQFSSEAIKRIRYGKNNKK